MGPGKKLMLPVDENGQRTITFYSGNAILRANLMIKVIENGSIRFGWMMVDFLYRNNESAIR